MLTPAGRVVSKAASIAPWPISWLIIAGGTAAVADNYASKTEKTVRDNQLIAAGACGKLQTNLGGGKELGCALTKAVKWDVPTIRQLCSGGIEGNL